jgi:hypothetical protein
LQVPASPETTAALGVTRWAINPALDLTEVLGTDDAGTPRSMFLTRFEQDASSGSNILRVLSMIQGPTSVRLQQKENGDVVVVQSNDFANHPDAVRALMLVDGDLAKSSAPAGAAGPASLRTLNLTQAVGTPLLCDTKGYSCGWKDVIARSGLPAVGCWFTGCSVKDALAAADETSGCRLCMNQFQYCQDGCRADAHNANDPCTFAKSLSDGSKALLQMYAVTSACSGGFVPGYIDDAVVAAEEACMDSRGCANDD